jgi:hypothetical protein
MQAHGLSTLTSELMAFAEEGDVKGVARMGAAEIAAQFASEAAPTACRSDGLRAAL